MRRGRNPTGARNAAAGEARLREGSHTSGGSGGNYGEPRCKVYACTLPLETPYHQKASICETHLKAYEVVLEEGGAPHRFCQQCGIFQSITEFDGTKRSCRTKLAIHAARRRAFLAQQRLLREQQEALEEEADRPGLPAPQDGDEEPPAAAVAPRVAPAAAAAAAAAAARPPQPSTQPWQVAAPGDLRPQLLPMTLPGAMPALGPGQANVPLEGPRFLLGTSSGVSSAGSGAMGQASLPPTHMQQPGVQVYWQLPWAPSSFTQASAGPALVFGSAPQRAPALPNAWLQPALQGPASSHPNPLEACHSPQPQASANSGARAPTLLSGSGGVATASEAPAALLRVASSTAAGAQACSSWAAHSGPFHAASMQPGNSEGFLSGNMAGTPATDCSQAAPTPISGEAMCDAASLLHAASAPAALRPTSSSLPAGPAGPGPWPGGPVPGPGAGLGLSRLLRPPPAAAQPRRPPRSRPDWGSGEIEALLEDELADLVGGLEFDPGFSHFSGLQPPEPAAGRSEASVDVSRPCSSMLGGGGAEADSLHRSQPQPQPPMDQYTPPLSSAPTSPSPPGAEAAGGFEPPSEAGLPCDYIPLLPGQAPTPATASSWTPPAVAGAMCATPEAQPLQAATPQSGPPSIASGGPACSPAQASAWASVSDSFALPPPAASRARPAPVVSGKQVRPRSGALSCMLVEAEERRPGPRPKAVGPSPFAARMAALELARHTAPAGDVVDPAAASPAAHPASGPHLTSAAAGSLTMSGQHAAAASVFSTRTFAAGGGDARCPAASHSYTGPPALALTQPATPASAAAPASAATTSQARPTTRMAPQHFPPGWASAPCAVFPSAPRVPPAHMAPGHGALGAHAQAGAGAAQGSGAAHAAATQMEWTAYSKPQAPVLPASSAALMASAPSLLWPPALAPPASTSSSDALWWSDANGMAAAAAAAGLPTLHQAWVAGFSSVGGAPQDDQAAAGGGGAGGAGMAGAGAMPSLHQALLAGFSNAGGPSHEQPAAAGGGGDGGAHGRSTAVRPLGPSADVSQGPASGRWELLDLAAGSGMELCGGGGYNAFIRMSIDE